MKHRPVRTDPLVLGLPVRGDDAAEAGAYPAAHELLEGSPAGYGVLRTYGGNPVACAAALATIETIEADDLITRAQQIERIMLDHPHIGGVSVIGIDDARLGEAGMAFVIPKPGSAPDAAEIIAWCKKEMANYKVPKRVVFVESLPLNASGKVLKHELRARARADGRENTPARQRSRA